MTAKEIQSKFIKEHLKPLLKQHWYFTKGQTWWRDQGDFFIIINLQNFSWNRKDDVAFCFNIGVALKMIMKDPDSRTPGYNDLSVILRQDAYLPDSRSETKHKNKTGYLIGQHTNFEDFTKELKADFEEEILPRLDRLKTINDCVDYYSNFSFWGDHLKRTIRENSL
jgi:hypothetical protein